MVIEVEDFGGGGFRFNGEPVNGNGEPTSADPEVLKAQLEEIKKYLPYLALIGVVFAVKHLKKNGLSKSVDLVALSNVITAFAPVITAFGWYLFTRVNDSAKVLSYIIATAETIPTIDLNLPPGVNLGAYFSVGEEMAGMVGWDGKLPDKEAALGLAEEFLGLVYDFFRPGSELWYPEGPPGK